jgi:hypothetical protein
MGKKTPAPLPPHPSLDRSIAFILRTAKRKPVSVRFLMKVLSGKGRYLMLIFLSLPFCQPIPLPGLSTLFGLLIMLFGISILFRKHVWLPQKLLNRRVSHDLIEKIASKALWIVKKLKPFVHQRLTWLTTHSSLRILNGILISLLGLFLAIPLPIPLTNLIPGWIIFLMALGLLEDDGVLILISYIPLMATFWLLIYIAIFHRA